MRRRLPDADETDVLRLSAPEFLHEVLDVHRRLMEPELADEGQDG